jgi:hypothetical protein
MVLHYAMQRYIDVHRTLYVLQDQLQFAANKTRGGESLLSAVRVPLFRVPG